MSENQPEQSPTEPRPVARVPRWLIATLIGGAVAIIALLAVVVLLLARGSNDDAPSTKATDRTSPSSKTKTFVVRGDITLIDSGVNFVGNVCYGTGGYDDMQGGAQVVVKDATGTTIAVGALDNGIKENSVTCRFGFTIGDVPSGSTAYSLEVTHRGSYSFTEDTASGIHLSLG